MSNFCKLMILLILVGCNSINKASNDGCVENLAFKKKFFSYVEYIEKNITEVQDAKFRNTLFFLSQYVHVSFESMTNYANTYPIGIFEEDKAGWLEWYEKNKCNNIQIIKNDMPN